MSSASFTHSVTVEAEQLSTESERRITRLEQTVREGVARLSQLTEQLEEAHTTIAYQHDVGQKYEQQIESLKAQLDATVNMKSESANVSQTESDVSD